MFRFAISSAARCAALRFPHGLGSTAAGQEPHDAAHLARRELHHADEEGGA